MKPFLSLQSSCSLLQPPIGFGARVSYQDHITAPYYATKRERQRPSRSSQAVRDSFKKAFASDVKPWVTAKNKKNWEAFCQKIKPLGHLLDGRELELRIGFRDGVTKNGGQEMAAMFFLDGVELTVKRPEFQMSPLNEIILDQLLLGENDTARKIFLKNEVLYQTSLLNTLLNKQGLTMQEFQYRVERDPDFVDLLKHDDRPHVKTHMLPGLENGHMQSSDFRERILYAPASRGYRPILWKHLGLNNPQFLSEWANRPDLIMYIRGSISRCLQSGWKKLRVTQPEYEHLVFNQLGVDLKKLPNPVIYRSTYSFNHFLKQVLTKLEQANDTLPYLKSLPLSQYAASPARIKKTDPSDDLKSSNNEPPNRDGGLGASSSTSSAGSFPPFDFLMDDFLFLKIKKILKILNPHVEKSSEKLVLS